MLPRTLEPEVMDTAEEARDYDAMDHGEVNRLFVDDFLRTVEAGPHRERLHDTDPLEVLDVGTGTAQIPIELCTRPVACRVVAIDLAGEMLRLAERNVAVAGLGNRILPQRADAKRLPWPDGRFPAVMSNSIVHHIPEPKQALAEMLRVLAPGGVLFVRDLLRPDDLDTLDRLVATYAGDENAHQQQMFRDSLHAALTLDELRGLLAELGAPPEWAAQTSDRHWTIAGTR
jgi:ubiquinone/menaquinone biosynthesis C-methylase UbiE